MTGAPIDLLYRLTQRDQAFPHWGPNFGLITKTLNELDVDLTRVDWDASSRPPAGTLLFLTNVGVTAIPNAGGEQSRELSLNVINRENDRVIATLLNDSDILVGPLTKTLRTNLDIAIILDRHYLGVRGEFTSAALDSTVTMTWMGYVVAQGEIGFS